MALFKRKTKNNIEDNQSQQAVHASRICGRDVAEIEAEIKCLKEEYGISPDEYLKKEYYNLSSAEQVKKANQTRLYRRKVQFVADATGWSYKDARSHIEKTKKEQGISTDAYIKKKLYLDNMKDNDEPVKKTGRDRAYWVAKIVERTGKDETEVLAELKRVRNVFDIKAGEYYLSRMYDMTDTQMAVKHKENVASRQQKKELYDAIEKISGKDRDQVDAEIENVNGMDESLHISVGWYYSYGLYELDFANDEEKLRNILEKSLRKKEIAHTIYDQLHAIDMNELSYADVEANISEYYALTKETLSEGRKAMYIEKIRYSMPEVELDAELRDNVAIDIYVTQNLLGFYPSEYVAFSFYGKSIEEKRTYLTVKQKEKALKLINGHKVADLLDSKHAAYERLEGLYKRDMLVIDSPEKYRSFVDFCHRNTSFVLKKNFESKGQGVEKVTLTEDTVLHDIFDDYVSDGNIIILEEMITPHDDIKKLNVDSVCSARIIIFADEGNTTVYETFMKVGRAGSFVDNVAAGGMYVHINKETGVFDSDGVDKRGVRYKAHPDHGYEFAGYQLPRWEEAIELAKTASLKINSTCFIGWDVTMNSEGEWIIVEGNANSTLVGGQTTMNKGIRNEFLSMIRFYDRLEEAEDEELSDDE